uniref:Uncharacterized protein n=1 Tax=Oikopleura dioica TaxID=34765 RepID=Q66S92_OIKDI|nr:hypothetical protein 007-03 [Oikopleura dioica]
MRKRIFVQKKKLGSSRVDVPLKRKKEYCKRIVELKEPYKEVKKLYLEEFGKPMSYSTFDNWKRNGYKILSSDFAAVNFRGSPKERINSRTDSDIADEEATIITMMEELELDHERAKDQEEEKEQEEEVVVVEIPKPSKKPTDKGKEKKKKEVQFKLTAFFKN